MKFFNDAITILRDPPSRNEAISPEFSSSYRRVLPHERSRQACFGFTNSGSSFECP